MPNTPALGLPYPSLSGVRPDVPHYLQALAEAIEHRMPRGLLPGGYAQRNTIAGPVNAGAGWISVAGLSCTVTLPTARRLLIIIQAQGTSNLAGTRVGVRLRNETNGGTGGEQTTYINVANEGMPLSTYVATSEAAGTYQFSVQHAHFGGPGGAWLTAQPKFIAIYDQGPA